MKARSIPNSIARYIPPGRTNCGLGLSCKSGNLVATPSPMKTLFESLKENRMSPRERKTVYRRRWLWHPRSRLSREHQWIHTGKRASPQLSARYPYGTFGVVCGFSARAANPPFHRARMRETSCSQTNDRVTSYGVYWSWAICQAECADFADGSWLNGELDLSERLEKPETQRND